jgi:hypothetical protein
MSLVVHPRAIGAVVDFRRPDATPSLRHIKEWI